jgi:hypothetical protein
VLGNLLTERRFNGSISAEQKRLVLDMMEQAGSLASILNAIL